MKVSGRGILSSIAVITLLSACGGGDNGTGSPQAAASGAPPTAAPPGGAGGTPPTTTVAQGVYVGKTSDERLVTFLFSQDGSYTLYYTHPKALYPQEIEGFLQGKDSVAASNFNSTGATAYSFAASKTGQFSISGKYAAQGQFSGTITDSAGGTITFTASYSAAQSQASGDFSKLASRELLLSDFYVLALGEGPGLKSSTFNSDGTFSGQLNGIPCSLSGKLTPQQSNSSVYAQLTLQGNACPYAGSYDGVGVVSVTNGVIYLGVPSSDKKTATFLALGYI